MALDSISRGHSRVDHRGGRSELCARGGGRFRVSLWEFEQWARKRGARSRMAHESGRIRTQRARIWTREAVRPALLRGERAGSPAHCEKRPPRLALSVDGPSSHPLQPCGGSRACCGPRCFRRLALASATATARRCPVVFAHSPRMRKRLGAPLGRARTPSSSKPIPAMFLGILSYRLRADAPDPPLADPMKFLGRAGFRHVRSAKSDPARDLENRQLLDGADPLHMPSGRTCFSPLRVRRGHPSADAGGARPRHRPLEGSRGQLRAGVALRAGPPPREGWPRSNH